MLTSPATFIGSTDNNMILLKAMLEQTVQDMASGFAWPELQKEYTFTLSTSTANYVLPADLDRIATETLWNRTQAFPLIGPLDAVEWQSYKSGYSVSLPRQRFRIKGWQTNQFYIDPTPTSDENGETVAYEYISKTCIRPKTWVASTSWAGLTYCSYNGNIYDRSGTGAGSTGTSAPVHTSGSVSDGSLTWAYVSAAYETFTYDSDEIILDNGLVTDGAIWRFKRERGLDYQDLMVEWNEAVDQAKTRLTSAGIQTVNGRTGPVNMIGEWSYPEGNYGI
jgi:hypothetical protein